VTDQVDTSAVAAARAGDRAVLDELVVQYLPLVYNIVRRALPSDDDVDDVVQETMVRLVRGIGGLREPESFRSWLVAITVNQIRDHCSRRHATIRWTGEHQEQPDPEAEFVDRVLDGLTLQQQRQELEPAARWLAPADRELLSLWALQSGGHISRAEIADALRTNAHNVTVKMGRLRNRLEAARLLTRALSADPRCPELAEAAAQWSGEPDPLWRKRMLRHLDRCPNCRRAGADLVPVHRLLIGAILLALPAGYAAGVLERVHSAVVPTTFSRPDHNTAATTRFGSGVRIAGVTVTKPVLVAAGVALAAACGVGAALVVAPGPEDRADATPITTRNMPSTPSLATTSAESTISQTSTPSTTVATTTPAPTTSAPARTATPTIKPTTTEPAQTPSAGPPLALDPTSSRMLNRLNERRRELGLPEVQESSGHVTEAYDCAAQNLRARTFDHCGHEVLYGGGGHPKPEDLVDSWFESPAHRTALTYPSSRWAGAVIVNNTENNRFIAAINIDY
jgi:RNA polymerase sigma factor (sigma-70 family)